MECGLRKGQLKVFNFWLEYLWLMQLIMFVLFKELYTNFKQHQGITMVPSLLVLIHKEHIRIFMTPNILDNSKGKRVHSLI